MLSIIKTALITITLSFISGVLLDHYKNYAPKIVCNIGRGRNIKTNNKKLKIYFLTIRNVSKKTIHNLNVNINAICDSLSVNDSKITKGLQFDITNEGNIYNVSIPFLSKCDEFTVKLLLEDTPGRKSKPIINLRSPENFKRIDSFENKYENITGAGGNGKNNFLDKYLFGNNKVIISIIGVLLVAFMGIFFVDYYNKSVTSNSSNYEEKEDGNTSNDTNKNINKDTKTTTNFNDESSYSKNKDYSNNEGVNGTSNTKESSTPSKTDINVNEVEEEKKTEDINDTGNSINSSENSKGQSTTEDRENNINDNNTNDSTTNSSKENPTEKSAGDKVQSTEGKDDTDNTVIP